MKALVVYYSRTGTTKIVAETIRAILQCDSEELKDTAKRAGLMGYMRSGRGAMKGETTELEPTKHDPAEYDIVIVGTPVWVYTVSTPVKTWLKENAPKIKNLAIFCTHDGNPGHTFEDMEAACGTIAKSRLAVRGRKAKSAEHVEETTSFVNVVKSA